MAQPIDNLNFKVILNDADFDTRIKKDIALAQSLNKELSKVVSINGTHKIIADDGVKNAQQMSQYLTEISNKIRTMPKGNFMVGDADKLNATLAETNKRLDQIIAKSQKAGSTGGSGANSLTRAWLRFSATLWGIISVIRIFTKAIGSAVKNIAAFQQANANLATIMQVTRREIEVLTNDALMLGRTTEWTASQVTELQTALAKLGYNIPQIQNMQASILQFATAVGAKLPDAANLAGASLRMFGMHSTEMQRALEILTASTNKTALDFEKLKVSLPYVGAIAHSIGFDIAQTASLLGVLTNAGLESSRAGTGLRQVLLELSKTNGKLQTAMGGNIKSFDDFVNGLQSMRDRGLQAGEATKLVSTRASSALLILANGVDTIRKLNDEVRDTDGLLKTIQADRLDTLHGSTLLLKSAWEGLIQTFRDSAGPMKDVVDWLRKIVNATSLAASRANRVAQGTKNVIGSDELSKQFKENFDSLIASGKGPEEAKEIVRKQMQQWLDSAYGELSDLQKKGYKESLFKRWLYDATFIGRPFAGPMKKGREANEQVEAMENAQDQVNAYMESRAKEEAEIAANAWLEEWKAIFDANGEKAARAAMSKVAGFDDIKAQMEAYIANGGAAGSEDRGKGGETAKERENRIIQGLKNEATYLRKLMDDYEKLEQYLGAEGANAKMVEIFGEGDYSKESIEQGILGITDALRNMGESGKEAAESIEQSMGLDAFSKYYKQLVNEKKAAEDAQKALEKYQTTLRKWMSEDFSLGGTGFEYDINKIYSDLGTNLGKVDEKYIQAVKQAEEAHKGDAAAIALETQRLAELRDSEKEYVRAKAQESLNDLAESYLKDEYFLRGINLDHLGEKSIAQLESLKKELLEVRNAALMVGADFSALESTLASWGIDIENITEDDLEALKDRLPETAIEMVRLMKATKDMGLSFDTLQQKIQSAIDKGLKNLDEEEKKSIGKLAKYAAKQVLELADAFRELGEATGNSGLTSAANTLSAIADVAKDAMEGFGQGGWIGAVIGGVISVAKKFVEAEAEAETFRKTLIRLNEEIRHTNAMASLSVDTIFGTNELKKIREAKKLLEDAYAALGGMTSVNVVRGRLVDESLFSRMRMHGLPLTDENGIINKDSLEAMKELYPDDERWQKAIDLVDEYYAALESIEEVGKSLVGNVVSSLTDQIVDSWWQAGEAALDYNDILADVAKGYAKLIVQESLMKAAFDDDRQKAFINALKNGDAGEAMGIIEGAMQSVVDMLPTVNDALQVLEPYRLLSAGGDDSNSVGAGIKSITEDQANLLASYFNAVRADVSVMRGNQEKYLPTLNDYMSKVAADTANIEQHTKDILLSTNNILSALGDVIGSEDSSGLVVRVRTV